MVTLKDIALLAGVSVSTVSRVLNGKGDSAQIAKKTQERVFKVAQELNYQPNTLAQSLRRGQNLKHILFLYFTEADDAFFLHPFFSHMLHGLQVEAARLGYYISYLGVKSQTSDDVLALIDGTVNGIITWGPVAGTIQEQIVRRRLPMVAIEPYQDFPGIENYTLYVDNRLAVSQAMEHLIELGHQRIALVSEGGCQLPQFQERRETYWEWVEKRNLTKFTNQESLDIPGFHILKAGTIKGREGLFLPWLAWEEHKRPTAVIATHDLAALSVLRILKSAGLKVPNDLSVIGIDDIDWSRYNEPALTTIQIPQEALGEVAVLKLDRLLSTGKKDKRESDLVQTKLIVRNTTCEPKF